MSRFNISGRATIVGTSALPLVSLYATSAKQPRVRQVAFFNTSATGGFTIALVRLTTTGTQGAGLSENPEDDPVSVAVATGFAGHTAGPTIGAEMDRYRMPAAVGGGVIWTFSERGCVIPAGTGNGVGLIVADGTGQLLDYKIGWDE